MLNAISAGTFAKHHFACMPVPIHSSCGEKRKAGSG